MRLNTLTPRTQRIFDNDLACIILRTDRMFFWLLIAQWVFAIGLALIWSPYTWIGERWLLHSMSLPR